MASSLLAISDATKSGVSDVGVLVNVDSGVGVSVTAIVWGQACSIVALDSLSAFSLELVATVAVPYCGHALPFSFWVPTSVPLFGLRLW